MTTRTPDENGQTANLDALLRGDPTVQSEPVRWHRLISQAESMTRVTGWSLASTWELIHAGDLPGATAALAETSANLSDLLAHGVEFPVDRGELRDQWETVESMGLLEGALSLDDLVQKRYAEEETCDDCEDDPNRDELCEFCWDFAARTTLDRLATCFGLLWFEDGRFSVPDEMRGTLAAMGLTGDAR